MTSRKNLKDRKIEAHQHLYIYIQETNRLLENREKHEKKWAHLCAEPDLNADTNIKGINLSIIWIQAKQKRTAK